MAILNILLDHLEITALAISVLLFIGVLYGMFKKAETFSPDVDSRWVKGRGNNSKNKQRAARAACNLFMEILQGERVAGTGRLINLSASGACFVSTSVLRKGDYVMARLPGLRSGANHIAGQIVWHKMTPTNTVYGIHIKSPARS